jgi:hypothetical protein
MTNDQADPREYIGFGVGDEDWFSAWATWTHVAMYYFGTGADNTDEHLIVGRWGSAGAARHIVLRIDTLWRPDAFIASSGELWASTTAIPKGEWLVQWTTLGPHTVAGQWRLDGFIRTMNGELNQSNTGNDADNPRTTSEITSLGSYRAGTSDTFHGWLGPQWLFQSPQDLQQDTAELSCYWPEETKQLEFLRDPLAFTYKHRRFCRWLIDPGNRRDLMGRVGNITLNNPRSVSYDDEGPPLRFAWPAPLFPGVSVAAGPLQANLEAASAAAAANDPTGPPASEPGGSLGSRRSERPYGNRKRHSVCESRSVCRSSHGQRPHRYGHRHSKRQPGRRSSGSSCQ